MSEATEIELDGRQLRLTNLTKVLWPQVGYTKGHLIDYYARVAPVLLPHLRGRPLTLARFPDGVDRPGWYQTDCWHHPDWVPTVPVPAPGGRGRGRDYCLVNDLPSLVWVVNLGTIELHPLLSCAPRIERPTAVVFDLDPGPPAGLLDAARVALLVRDVLDARGLVSLVKTSGAAGMHLHVPLNTPHTYETTKPFARSVARVLTERHPDLVVDQQNRARRTGRTLVDWIQNDASRSLTGVYSLRAQPVPTVSTPVTWDEVEDAIARGAEEDLLFGPAEVLDRVARLGDVYQPVLEVEQSLVS